jgi:iron complex transport system substrate-binding protein
MTPDQHWQRPLVIWRRLARAVLCAGLVAAGPIAPARGAANLTRGCVQTFDATADYFPDKVPIEDAVNFGVDYHRSYKLVTVRDVGPDREAERYVLVQCGTPAPRLEGPLAGAQVITVPVSSMFASSTTHLSLLVDLGRLDVLTGVGRFRELLGDALQARIATGRVREFAPMSVIDAELVVSHRPSVLMTTGGSSAALPTIRAAGIPVMANTEWLEPSALARAEWLKYAALLLNEERRAQTLYSAMKTRYRSLSAKAAAQPESARPLVMTGRGTRGTFTIAGGRSYVAALIKDAGGRYVWADNPSAGAPSIDLEAQIARAGSADIWINGGGWTSLAGMLDDEPRYIAFKAYRQKQVWVYERRLTPTGGNDYWLRSVSHPDVVLADLIKIFHPTLLPEHPLEWYMRVPDR